jgi:molybdenum cofactor cytidylyltransferase
MANEQMHSNHNGVILLAAGASSRLGSPKQLLDFAGSKLLQHAIDTALASDAMHVVVVLGANAEIIKQELKETTAAIVENDAWKEGMASSIRFGLQTLVKLNPEVEAAVFMVADQPFVTADLLNELMELNKKERHNIVASKYGTTFGTPVLFSKRFFPELMELTGDTGAKSLVRKYQNETAFVPFPKGEIDIDTMEDYEKAKGGGFKA